MKKIVFLCALVIPFWVAGQITIKTNDVSRLFADQSTLEGSIRIENGQGIWYGQSTMTWFVDVKQSGNYKFNICYTVPHSSAGTQMSIQSSSGRELKFNLRETFGPTAKYERHAIQGELSLPVGQQRIQLKSIGATAGQNVMGIRSLEIFPVSAESAIVANINRARAARPNTDWMLKAKYGVMFHWNPLCVDENNKTVPYDQMVRDLNVSAFANMVAQTGAGYVLFTFTHGGNTAPAPLTTWPGPTTQRDLIMEIADSLNARGIKLMLYGGQWALNVMTEIGTRYGTKLAGYWFDGGWTTTHNNPNYDCEAFYWACKAGNPNRLIALNYWIYPFDTEWQDFWAGEVAGLTTMPSSRFAPEGPIAGLQSHLLIMLEDNWWLDNINKKPVLTRSQLSSYVSQAIARGVAITINVMIHPDGTILPASMDILKGLKEDVKNLQPVVSIAPTHQQKQIQDAIIRMESLSIYGGFEGGTVSLFNGKGELFREMKLVPGKNIVSFKDMNLSSGIYLWKYSGIVAHPSQLGETGKMIVK
jgi:hypothetical protein